MKRQLHFVRTGTIGVAAMVTLSSTQAFAQAQTADTSATRLSTFKVEESAKKSYKVPASNTATKTPTLLRDIPQSITVITSELIKDQGMLSIGDVVRYVPGVNIAQGEGNRDTPVFRGNSSTSDFYVDGIRDDVQYFRDLYNVERVEALKGANAMIFGRGGVGGVFNRVTKQANWNPIQEFSLQGGSYTNRRGTGDVGFARGASAFRLTGAYENSQSYRDGVGIERYGLNPTAAFALGAKTRIRVGYEYFHDERNADRGVPSFGGRPFAGAPSTFFGDPDRSPTNALVRTGAALIEHSFTSNIVLRNRTSYGVYDKFYQNIFPGAINNAGTTVAISAYNNRTDRTNTFNQTDLVISGNTGAVRHTLLAGAEFARQVTDNFRNTGYFNNTASTSDTVALANPRTVKSVTFRQGATDADNHGGANLAAVYLQDQVELTSKLQAVVGVRYDQFRVDFTNNRTMANFKSKDTPLSPRAGLIVKPIENVSVYGSYSLSFLPRSGEQLSSLSLTNAALDPEQFTNYEVGAKWDVNSMLSLTSAVFQLDRSNVAITDPNDATKQILVDGQRTKGIELGVSGNFTSKWSMMGGYSYQDGKITRDLSATVKNGATLAMLPTQTASLWNRYDVTRHVGLALGAVHQSKIYTSTDNLVTMPEFTRFDGGAFITITQNLRAQVNVENIFDREYFSSANSNNNITPGSPRAFRLSLTTRF